jgi:hypothetical protein
MRLEGVASGYWTQFAKLSSECQPLRFDSVALRTTSTVIDNRCAGCTIILFGGLRTTGNT